MILVRKIAQLNWKYFSQLELIIPDMIDAFPPILFNTIYFEGIISEILFSEIVFDKSSINKMIGI